MQCYFLTPLVKKNNIVSVYPVNTDTDVDVDLQKCMPDFCALFSCIYIRQVRNLRCV